MWKMLTMVFTKESFGSISAHGVVPCSVRNLGRLAIWCMYTPRSEFPCLPHVLGPQPGTSSPDTLTQNLEGLQGWLGRGSLVGLTAAEEEGRSHFPVTAAAYPLCASALIPKDEAVAGLLSQGVWEGQLIDMWGGWSKDTCSQQARKAHFPGRTSATFNKWFSCHFVCGYLVLHELETNRCGCGWVVCV